MKKLHLIILFVSVAMSSLAQTVGEAFYIYRNDGEFNAFFRDEVDSIAYSNYDTDSIYFDEAVMQVVYTQDSIYRIPLAAIDSVGFVQPETKFQSNVMRMDETWLPYIIGITGNSITFKTSTPATFLPQQGQVMVAETFEYPFETGFSGRVSEIKAYSDSIVYTVEEVLISDIYQRLVTVGMSYSDGAEESVSRAPKRIWGMNTNHGVKFKILPITDLEVGPVTISCTPTVVMKYIVCLWEQNLKDYVEIRCHHTYDGSVSINAKLEKDYHPEPKWFGPGLNVPTPVPGLYGRVQFGGFFRATGSVQLSATKKFYRNGVTGFVYSEDNGFREINEWDNPSKEDWEASVSIDGSISAGLAGRLQFGIAHEKLASADVTLYVGPEISGHAELKGTELVADKNLYSSIKDSEITLSLIADVVVGYQLVGFKSSKVMPEPPTHEEPMSLKFTWPLNHWYLVPEFDNLKWQADVNGGDLSGDIKRNLLPKVSLGWALYDVYDNLYKSEYFPETYRKLEDWPHQGLFYHLDDLKKNTTYKAYPMVKLLGLEMRTDKSVDVCVHECPVTLSDFKVTKSQYQKGAFTNDGKTYDYKFDVSVTATLDNSEGVTDWGYVYRDPNGREKEISLMKFGTRKIDDRYAYFRNNNPSTCTLFGYVKYEGSKEPIYGEPTDFELVYEPQLCPDDNHPHMIDLGLPSGTKWACCNIGASEPKEIGGYYAWGELETKSQYGNETYKYFIKYVKSQYGDWPVPVYANIGTDISGTDYDVAHVKWGVGWRMPTMDEMKELKNYCSSSWFNLNGKGGRLYTGPNGNIIFLPAGGWYTNTFSSSNNYWTSTLDPDQTNCESSKYGWYPYVLDIDDHSDCYCSRGGGIPVRPISSGNAGYSRKNLHRNAKQLETNKEWHPVIENGIVIKY